jgi:hypothetical protein
MGFSLLKVRSFLCKGWGETHLKKEEGGGWGYPHFERLNCWVAPAVDQDNREKC